MGGLLNPLHSPGVPEGKLRLGKEAPGMRGSMGLAG